MNFYLATKESYAQKVIPILWSSAKTYYEEQGNRVAEWNWADPWLAYNCTEDSILEKCKQEPPDVFGFSVYVWNEQFMDNLAEMVKKEFPNCLIVYGGPQVNIKYSENFFKDKPWVDVVCPSSSYGEVIIKEILDNYPITDFDIISDIYYTNSKKEKLVSKRVTEKKQFQWPKNIFKAQENHFLSHNDIHNIMLETTRGCPYKCIYCDWGGGTYTKVVSKPYTTILDELEWIAKNKIVNLELNSANFGILPIDVDIAEYIAQLNKTYGFPKHVYSENAKNSIDRVGKIKSIWAKAGLLNHYKVSVQTISDEIKNNIERIDPPIEKQVEVINQLKKHIADLPIKVETIIGLPGDSYQVTLDQINTLFHYDLPMARYNIWMLLPEAPAYDPEMRAKFKIKTINKVFSTHPWTLKLGFPTKPWLWSSFNLPPNPNTESVVSTYSYTSDEFVDMLLVNSLAVSGAPIGLNDFMIKYIVSEYSVSPSEILDFIYKNFIKNIDKWQDPSLAKEISKIYNTVANWTTGDLSDIAIDYDPEFPLLLSVNMYLAFTILTNINSFYKQVSKSLSEKYSDDKILDLGNYLSNCTIDLDYNPVDGRTFSTKYDWYNFFNGSSKLIEQNCTYQINDTQIFTNGRLQEILWHLSTSNIQAKEQYTYQQLGDYTIPKISRNILKL